MNTIDRTKVGISEFDAFCSYTKALEEMARQSAEKSGKMVYQELKELKERYGNAIKEMNDIRTNLGAYKKNREQQVKLADLRYKFEKLGLTGFTVSRICKKAIKRNEDGKDKIGESIIDSAKKTKGLPVESKYVLKGGKYEYQEAYHVPFRIDANEMQGFINDVLANITLREVLPTERSQAHNKILQYAAKNKISFEEAKEQIEKEELREKLSERHGEEMHDIDTISQLLNATVPSFVKSNYSEKDLEVLQKNINTKRKELLDYEKTLTTLAEQEKRKADLEDVAKHLETISDSAIDKKQKGKLMKKIKKEMVKVSETMKKTNERLTVLKKSDTLSQYFDNMEYYESVLSAQKALDMENRGFDTTEAKVEEWKANVSDFWNREIAVANSKKKIQTYALPPSFKQNETKQDFVPKVTIDHQKAQNGKGAEGKGTEYNSKDDSGNLGEEGPAIDD